MVFGPSHSTVLKLAQEPKTRSTSISVRQRVLFDHSGTHASCLCFEVDLDLVFPFGSGSNDWFVLRVATETTSEHDITDP